MSKLQRWLCRECQREWLPDDGGQGRVYVLAPDERGVPQKTAWTEALGCPVCRSMAIALESYTPAFPGGDIPRVPTAIDVPIPIDTSKARQENQTIALSQPPLWPPAWTQRAAVQP